MTEEIKEIINNIDWDKLKKDSEYYQKQKFNFKKTVYVASINTSYGIYMIFRLSNKAREKVKLIHCGKAYTEMGEGSTQYLKHLEKYNIDDDTVFLTANTRDKLYQLLFFASIQHSKNGWLETPNTVYEMLKDYVDRWIKEE